MLAHRRVLFFVILGIVSGCLSAWLDSGNKFIVPGICFGVAVLIGFQEFRLKRIVQNSMWVALSTASYYIAVSLTVQVMAEFITTQLPNITEQQQFFILFFIGGIIGATLMLLSLHFLITPLSMKEFFCFVLLGGLLGLSGPIESPLGFPDSFLQLYVVWQTGMMLALSLVSQKAISNQT